MVDPEGLADFVGLLSESNDPRFRLSALTALLPELVQQIKQMEWFSSLALVGSLLTCPEYHANATRLETLAHLIALHACGRQQITAKHLNIWLNKSLEQVHVNRLGACPRNPQDRGNK
jgi:hypothetical protein